VHLIQRQDPSLTSTSAIITLERLSMGLSLQEVEELAVLMARYLSTADLEEILQTRCPPLSPAEDLATTGKSSWCHVNSSASQ
jgi:hypothetical protein